MDSNGNILVAVKVAAVLVTCLVVSYVASVVLARYLLVNLDVIAPNTTSSKEGS